MSGDISSNEDSGSSETKNNGIRSVLRESHACTYCGGVFSSWFRLYEHLFDSHDPDGVMYSEFGPK
jgi:hypothetical protein